MAWPQTACSTIRRAGFGAVPDDVWRHPEVRVLVLAENGLTHVPARLGTLRALHTLDLGHNLLAHGCVGLW